MPGTIHDARLLADVRRVAGSRRDDASFRRVFEVYYPRLHGFFAKRVHPSQSAHDLTQETFLRVLRGEGTFASIAQFEGWLFRTATNVFRNAFRAESAQKRSGREQSLDALKEIVADELTPWQVAGRRGPNNPQTHTLDRERMVVLAKVIKGLPHNMQRCFVLRLYHGMTNREIAERMNISDQTVKAHLYQARKRLKTQLAEAFRGFDAIEGDEAGP